VNDNWIHKFADSQAHHLPRTHADHYPFLLTLSPLTNLKRDNFFRFETMWATHPYLQQIICNWWDGDNNIHFSIVNFQKKVTEWNYTTFGNIFCKKRKIMKRLKGIQKSSNYAYNSFLIQLEDSLIKEYNHLLWIEEEFWKLKSRVNWLNEGDANTRFFHTTTLNRRRRNRIVNVLSEEGKWIYNQNEIKISTFNYFNKLFYTSHIYSKLQKIKLNT